MTAQADNLPVIPFGQLLVGRSGQSAQVHKGWFTQTSGHPGWSKLDANHSGSPARLHTVLQLLVQ